MRSNIISIVGFLIVLIIALFAVLNSISQDIKKRAIITEVLLNEDQSTRKIVELRVNYNEGGTAYPISYFNIGTDTSKYVVGNEIDVYLASNNLPSLKPIRGKYYLILIPLSYILLIGVCYYTFKN